MGRLSGYLPPSLGGNLSRAPNPEISQVRAMTDLAKQEMHRPMKGVANQHLQFLKTCLVAPLIRERVGYARFDDTQISVELVDQPTLESYLLEEVRYQRKDTLPPDVEKAVRQAAGGMVGAVYLHGRRGVALRVDVARVVPFQDVCTMVLHESIHAAQHQTFPDFEEALRVKTECLRQLIARDSVEAASEVARTVHARKTLIEGEAVYWQRQLRSAFTWEPDTQLENLLTSETFKPHEAIATAQYVVGEQAFRQLAKDNALPFVDRLFEQPTLADKYLVDKDSLAKLASSVDRFLHATHGRGS